MEVSSYSISEQQSKQVFVFFACAGLLLLTAWCLRDAQAATTTSTVEVNIVSTVNLVARNGIVFGDCMVYKLFKFILA